jgi:hypothetical protein
MKILNIISLILALALLPDLAFSAEYGRARIGFLSGDVQIQTAGASEWVPASTNTPLQDGDRMWVPGEARTEVQVLGGIIIRLDAFTSLDAISLGGESIQFYMNEGHAYINNRKSGIDSVQIDTPLSSINCEDDSLARVDVSESGATELSVLRGIAYAETRNGKLRVQEGNTLLIREDLTAELYPLGSPDDWEAWNGERDQELTAGRESRRYLPYELNDYVSDFDENGRWLSTADYGYVWTPSVSVSLDWAPYRVGRWAWMGGNYVWISYEPWGWAPYHYGRWVFLGGRGWCWVPPRRGAAHWGPGYVGWVHTPTYVSWVPLAPGDTYYGHGNYGPGSVNMNSINTLNIHRNFRNIDARNAVTSMHRDTFFYGRRSDFRVRENPFKQRNVGFGPPPAVRPDRSTISPVIRSIPVAKLPPPQLQRIEPEKIRRERRLVTDERSSVFVPAGPARQMPTIRREAPRRPGQLQKPEQFREIQGKPRGKDEVKMERTGQEGTVVRPTETGPVTTGKEKPPITTPAPPRQPAIGKPYDGRTERYRIQSTPSVPVVPSAVPAEKPQAPVKPLKEKTPRTTGYPAPPAPMIVSPGTPPSATEKQPTGQTLERSRFRTTPGEIPTGRQPGAATGTTSDRSGATSPQGIRLAPQPVAPTPAWRPQKPQLPASTVQPAARTPLPQVQSPVPVSPPGQQHPAQPLKIQRQPSPSPQGSSQGQQMNRHQPSGQQPKVLEPSGQKPPEKQESETKGKTRSKNTGAQQQTGTIEIPPLYPSQGQGRTGPR